MGFMRRFAGIWQVAVGAALCAAAPEFPMAGSVPDASGFLSVVGQIAALPRLDDPGRVGALLGTTFAIAASPMQSVDIDCATLVNPNIPACAGKSPITARQTIHYRPARDSWLCAGDDTCSPRQIRLDFSTRVDYRGDPPTESHRVSTLWIRNISKIACVTEATARAALPTTPVKRLASRTNIQVPWNRSIFVELLLRPPGFNTTKAECALEVIILQQTGEDMK